MLMINVVKAIVVRAALLLHITMTVWRVTVDLKDDMYWLMFVGTLPFFIETLYTVIKRKGDDFLLFTPCFFFYLLTTIPCVWLLELRKTDVYLAGEEDMLFNKTIEEIPSALEGLDLEINPNTWTILIEELLLYLLIIGRWILPRGQVTREQLSELLFAFIGIASDIMEMFSLFGEEEVRRNRTLSYCVLGVWSLSVTQFCMTLTVTHRPRKAKNIRVIDDNDAPAEKKATIRHEIIAIILSMLMQDIPFVSVRLYTIITYDLITYSLIFFTAKNCLVICLLIYKIAVLLQKKYCPENAHQEMEEDDKELYIIGKDDIDGNSSNGKKPKTDNLNDTGSASTGGSKEKEKLEKYYEENENEIEKPSKNKIKDKLKNGEDITDSPSPSAKYAPKEEAPKKSPNEKTPLTPTKVQGNGQSPQSSSTPSLNKRTPMSSNVSTPKTPSKSSSNVSRPRPTPTNTPKAKTPSQKPTSQQKQQQSPRHQQPPPQQQQQPPPPPVDSGFGWISSKPKGENDDVIVANLS